MRPKKSILDPTFKYTPSHQTDIRRTFRKARREQQPQQQGIKHTIILDQLNQAQYWDPVLQFHLKVIK